MILSLSDFWCQTSTPFLWMRHWSSPARTHSRSSKNLCNQLLKFSLRLTFKRNELHCRFRLIELFLENMVNDKSVALRSPVPYNGGICKLNCHRHSRWVGLGAGDGERGTGSWAWVYACRGGILEFLNL